MDFERGKPHPFIPGEGDKCKVCEGTAGYFIHKMYKGPPVAIEPSKDVSHFTPPLTQEEVNKGIEEAAKEASEVARSVQVVEHQFPQSGFIDPETDLERLRRIANAMLPEDRAKYPEAIRAKILAKEANKKDPSLDYTIEEVKLALFIKRTQDSPLTEEDLEAKATGRKKREPKEKAEVKPSAASILGVKK